MPFSDSRSVKAGGRVTWIILCSAYWQRFGITKAGGREPTVPEQYRAWWINKFNEEGYKTFNATKPRITIADLKKSLTIWWQGKAVKLDIEVTIIVRQVRCPRCSGDAKRTI